MELLRVENLSKSYGKGEAKVDALKNINLSIKKGEFISRSNTAYRNHL